MDPNKAAILRNRRSRKLVIERNFQYRFALMLCLIGGGIFALFSGMLLYFMKVNYETFIQEAVIQFPDVVNNLKQEFRFLSLFIVSNFVIMVTVLFFLGLILSQRVAGPVYALKRQLQDFGHRKKPVRLSLRTEDEFRNLEEVFNWAMHTHEQNEATDLNKLRDISALIETKKTAEAAIALNHFIESRK